MKLKAFIISFIMILSVATGVAYADEEYFREAALKYTVIEEFEAPQISLFAAPAEPIEDFLKSAFENHETAINLYENNYMITKNQLCVILSKHYEYMIVGGTIAFRYFENPDNSNDPYIYDFYPIYLFEDKNDDAQGKAFIEACVKEYADYARASTNDPLEQLLLVHDKMLRETTYDFSYQDQSFSAYGLFKNKTSVCYGYAEALYLIAKELGIESGYGNYSERTSSGFEGHIWNYMKIDGKWYQLDATWDEPTTSQGTEYSNSTHNYFMVTDEIIDADHKPECQYTSFDVAPVCNDDRYLTNHLFNVIYLCDINYNNNSFEADLGSGMILKSYNGLYTGPIITSKIYETEENYNLKAYFMEDFQSFDILLCTRDGNSLETCSHYILEKNSDSSSVNKVMDIISIKKADYPDTSPLEVFLWDFEALMPLSGKVKIH